MVLRLDKQVILGFLSKSPNFNSPKF